MNKIVFILLLLIYSTVSAMAVSPQQYYKAFSDSSITSVNRMLDLLEKDPPSSRNNAYKGAMLMKKARLLNKPAQKLQYFKKGKALLEKEITDHPKNIEYRFLRLVIQENAPPIVKYSGNISADKSTITSRYMNVREDLRKVILNYSKKSIILDYRELKAKLN